MFYKIISQVNGCQNFVFIGQVIPVLKTVFDSIYGTEYKLNGNYLLMNGAKYVKLNGNSVVDKEQIQPQWQIYFGTDSHVPNFDNKQVIGNQLKNTSDQNFYKASFNYYTDQTVKINGATVQKPVLSNPDEHLNDPQNNEYTIDFNNKALPKHEHRIYEFTKETRTIMENKQKTGTKYTQYQPEDNIHEMNIHNTDTLKNTKSTPPEDYPAVLNVSDPCIDVYYLLCVGIEQMV